MLERAPCTCAVASRRSWINYRQAARLANPVPGPKCGAFNTGKLVCDLAREPCFDVGGCVVENALRCLGMAYIS